MTRISKKTLLAVVLALCFALGLGALAACNNENGPSGANKTYTVTVTLSDGGAAAGVSVSVKKGTATFETKATGSDGKVSFDLAEDDYEIALSNLPEHYEADPSIALELKKDHADLSVILVRKFAYKVYLVDENEQPFYREGVQMGVCTDNNCLPTVDLDSNGLATIEVAKGNYHVQIVDLPAGYTYRQDAKGYYSLKQFTADDSEMSIMIYAVQSVDIVNGTALTAAEKTALQETFYYFDVNRTAYKVSATLAKHTVKYYSVTPAFTGMYYFYRVGDAADYFDGETFAAASTGNYLGQYEVLTAGKTYYFALGNATDEDMGNTDLIIALPYSTYNVYNGVGGTVELTVGKAATNAIIEYTPASTGIYAATAQGEALAIVSATTEDIPNDVLDPAPDDAEYVKGSSASVDINEKAIANGKKIYFAVTVKADTYPATVSVKIERKGDSENAYTYAQVKETLTQYTKKAGTELYGVPMDGSAEIVYGDDGYYHLKDKDGAIIVVLLTKPLDKSRYEDKSTLAYMDMENGGINYYVNTAEEGQPEKKLDYTIFLRGFDEYEYDVVNDPVIPEEIKTEVYYAKYVNEDGAYPLTKELEAFLKYFYQDTGNKESIDWQTYDAPQAWMFPLYYYDAEIVPDAICGEYKFVSHTDAYGEVTEVGGKKDVWDDTENKYVEATIGDDEYKLVIGKKNTFEIYQITGSGEYDEDWPAASGSWSKDGDTYTFVEPDAKQNPTTWATEDLVYTVTITADTITHTGNDGEEGGPGTVWVFKIPAAA